MENNDKRKYYLIIGIVTILLFIVGASYAYFTVGTTNNFGTHTISGTMEDVGSVSLVSTGNNISLNLTAADMMQGNDDIVYFGTTDGTSTSFYNAIKLADAIVTGPGYYDCDYTMSITASGTNNMYVAFQGMSDKSDDQIGLFIGDNALFGSGSNREEYDFNTANLFPITYNGHFSTISSSNPKNIYGLFMVTNSSSINQTALAGTDITLSLNITSFTCRALAKTYLFWNDNFDFNRYQDATTLVNNNYLYYIKTLVVGSEDISNEACGVFGSTEVCLNPNDWENVTTYKSRMEAIGATCNLTDSELYCIDSVSQLTCRLLHSGEANCGINSYCVARTSGSTRCYGSSS